MGRLGFNLVLVNARTGVLASRMFTVGTYVSVVVRPDDLGPNASDERIRVAAAGDLSGSEISLALIAA